MPRLNLSRTDLPPPDVAERAALERQVVALVARRTLASVLLFGFGVVALAGSALAACLGHAVVGLRGTDLTLALWTILFFTLGAPLWMPAAGLFGSAVAGMWLQSLNFRIRARKLRLARSGD